MKILHFPGFKPTRKGTQLPRQVGRAAHHAMRAALLQRNLRILSEAWRVSVVRPLIGSVATTTFLANGGLVLMRAKIACFGSFCRCCSRHRDRLTRSGERLRRDNLARYTGE